MSKLRNNLVFLIIVLILGVGLSVWHSRFEQTFVIHFVNYRGKTAVDDAYEKYLKKKGVHYRIIYHDANLDPASIPKIRDEIAADKKKSLVVTWGTPTTLGVFGKYTDGFPPFIRDVPGVFTLVTDPVQTGVIAPAPEFRTITGASHVAPIEHQFSAMMIYRPAKKIGILYTETEINAIAAVKNITGFAAMFHVDVVAIPLTVEVDTLQPTNVEAAIQQMKNQGVDWLYLGPDTFLSKHAVEVIGTAHRLNLPTFASTEDFMEQGAAFGLVSPFSELGRVAGEQTYQILVEGVKPANIPIALGIHFLHEYNKPVADKLGMQIRSELINEVIDVSKKNK
jgi:putative ABC transport system substrate-binding protein